MGGPTPAGRRTSRYQVSDALTRLRHARTNALRSEDYIAEAVADARAAGATWQAIADVLGIAQPNAVRKFGPLQRSSPDDVEERAAV